LASRVVRGAAPAPPAMVAGDEPPLAIAGVAVGVIRGPAELAPLPGFLVPAHDPVVGNVAPQHVAAVAEPHRPLAPAHARRKLLERRVEQPEFGEARIEHFDGGGWRPP